jgi:alpha-methylacyl-CoA racemase
MLLADLGADVVRIDRPGTVSDQVLSRGKRSIALDLKRPDDIALAMDLADRAELLVEGYRPGVMERLGLGPDILIGRNPALVYGRMTGWGQTGPLSHTAGHDINYLALTGVLHAIGPADAPPPPPLNLVADFGGGSLYLVMGLLAALTRARATGEGQIVDAAMTDGAISLAGLFQGLLREGRWQDQRMANYLDGAAPWYRCYRCQDGKFVAVGAIEPQFWQTLREKLELTQPIFDAQNEVALWPEMAARMEALFAQRPRDEWCALTEGTDACLSPVLSFAEAPAHPHNVARGAFLQVDGGHDAAPVPRLSRTPARISGPPPATDADRNGILEEWLGCG